MLTSYVRATVILISPLSFDVSNTFTRCFAYREACPEQAAYAAKISVTTVVSTVADDELSAR